MNEPEPNLERSLALTRLEILRVAQDPGVFLKAVQGSIDSDARLFENLEKITDPILRIKAYLVTAQSRLVAGHDANLYFDLAQKSIDAELTGESWSSRRQFQNGHEATRLEIELRKLELDFGRPLSSSQIDQMITTIHSYNLGLGIPERKGELAENYLERVCTSVLDLYALAEVVFRMDDEESRDIILAKLKKAIEEIIADKIMNAHLGAANRVQNLTALLKVQLMMGDVSGLQETAKTISQTRPTSETWYGGDGDEYEVLASAKVEPLAIAYAVNSQIATGNSIENIEPSRIESLLMSDRDYAKSIGYLMHPDEIEKYLSRADISDEIKRDLLFGMRQRIEADEKEMQIRKRILELRSELLSQEEQTR